MAVEKAIYTKDYKKVIEKLKKARVSAGLTQVEVAKILKKPQSYISKVERGDQRIDIIELKSLAKLYKKSVQCFIS